MGMFDSVIYQCACGNPVEWQAKSGDCLLNVYIPSSIPLPIAVELNGCEERCQKCGKLFRIKNDNIPIPEMIPMIVEEIKCQ